MGANLQEAGPAVEARDVTDCRARLRRVRIRFAILSERVNAMAGRRHKGDRALIQTRPYDEVLHLVIGRQHAAGIKELSPYLADVLAIHVGREDLVTELGHTQSLPLDQDTEAQAGPYPGRRTLVQTRPHRAVWTAVHERQKRAGVSSVSQYVADVLAMHVGREDLVVELGRKEGLPLAM